jgi:O-antigen/teichoic acid export membrane protein
VATASTIRELGDLDTAPVKQTACPEPDVHADDLDRPPSPESRASDAVGTTTGASVVGSGLWHLSAKLMPQVYVLVISITAARILGPDGMGQQSFMSFVQVSVVLLFTGGLSAALMRYTAELVGQGAPDVVRGLLRWGWRLLTIGSLTTVVLLAAVGWPRGELRAAWMLAAAAGGIAVLHAVPHAVLTGLQRWREASIVSLTTGAAGAIGTLLVLRAGYGITGMFAVEVVVTTANLLWVSGLVRREVRKLGTEVTPPAPALRRRIRNYAAGAWVHLVLFLVVWRRSELFILDWTSTDAQIAMYSVAFATLGAARQIPGALAQTLAPAVATLYGAGEMLRIDRGFGRGLRLLTIMVLPMTAGLLAVGPRLLTAAFGSEYADAAAPLLIMTLVFPLLPLNSMCSGVLHGLALIRPVLVASGVATVVNVALALLLIPDGGAVGAAWANSGAQLTAAVLMLTATLRALPDARLHLRSVLPTVLASALCGGAAYLVVQGVPGLLGVVLAIGAGVATFGLAATILGILPADDAAWLDGAMGARLGGVVGKGVRLVARRDLGPASDHDDDGRGTDD